MVKKNALILFVKNPSLGGVKTRIAASVGDAEALAVYENLLSLTFELAVSCADDADVFVFYSDFLPPTPPAFSCVELLQSENKNLGMRMADAFVCVFALGYARARR